MPDHARTAGILGLQGKPSWIQKALSNGVYGAPIHPVATLNFYGKPRGRSTGFTVFLKHYRPQMASVSHDCGNTCFKHVSNSKVNAQRGVDEEENNETTNATNLRKSRIPRQVLVQKMLKPSKI